MVNPRGGRREPEHSAENMLLTEAHVLKGVQGTHSPSVLLQFGSELSERPSPSLVLLGCWLKLQEVGLLRSCQSSGACPWKGYIGIPELSFFPPFLPSFLLFLFFFCLATRKWAAWLYHMPPTTLLHHRPNSSRTGAKEMIQQFTVLVTQSSGLHRLLFHCHDNNDGQGNHKRKFNLGSWSQRVGTVPTMVVSMAARRQI